MCVHTCMCSFSGNRARPRTALPLHWRARPKSWPAARHLRWESWSFFYLSLTFTHLCPFSTVMGWPGLTWLGLVWANSPVPHGFAFPVQQGCPHKGVPHWWWFVLSDEGLKSTVHSWSPLLFLLKEVHLFEVSCLQRCSKSLLSAALHQHLTVAVSAFTFLPAVLLDLPLLKKSRYQSCTNSVILNFLLILHNKSPLLFCEGNFFIVRQKNKEMFSFWAAASHNFWHSGQRTWNSKIKHISKVKTECRRETKL